MNGCQGSNIYEVKRKKRKIGGVRRRPRTYHQIVDREALVASKLMHHFHAPLHYI